MAGVEFENDYRPTAPQSPAPGFSPFQQTEARGMPGWLMKKGIIKNESQAGTVLLIVVILNFILAGFVLIYFVF